MRIALAQINTTVGDIEANCRKTLEFIGRAAAGRAEIVVFPELSIIGYPPKDLLLKPDFVRDNLAAVEFLARRVGKIDVVVGYAQPNDDPVGRPLHNAVALLREGRVVSRHFKTLLPTYDVFDETRYFEPAPAKQAGNLVQVGGVPVGLSICEDLWNDEKMIPRRLYHRNPIADLHQAGAKILINTSASPFVLGKHEFRRQLFSSQMRQFRRPLVYVNQVGGNDELVFDGNSVVFDAAGNVIAQAKDFEEDLLIVDVPEGEGAEGCAQKMREDIDGRLTGIFPSPGTPGEGEGGGLNSPPKTPTPTLPRSTKGGSKQASVLSEQIRADGAVANGQMNVPSAGVESIHKALLLGLRDYVRKCGFTRVVLGLSGGIDSAVTAALAVAALGADRVVGVAMPGRFSSDHSLIDARELAANLKIEFHVVPINEVHEAYEHTLAEPFAGREPDVTEENLQARIRGALLMAFSNKFGHLLLTTGNKSELAVGYCTLYGDMAGGLALISDVPKTRIWELARWINRAAGRELIPQRSIDKVPSAELRPNQTDQDSLLPYPILDEILQRYVEEEMGAAEIIAAGFDEATVVRVIGLIDRSEYKRRQSAPGIKITSRAFGFGRRMPIAQNYRHGYRLIG